MPRASVSNAQKRILCLTLRRNGDVLQRFNNSPLPVIAESNEVAALDPKQADVSLCVDMLEADADGAALVEQCEIAVGKIVNVLLRFGDYDLLPIEPEVHSENARKCPSFEPENTAR